MIDELQRKLGVDFRFEHSHHRRMRRIDAVLWRDRFDPIGPIFAATVAAEEVDCFVLRFVDVTRPEQTDVAL